MLINWTDFMAHIGQARRISLKRFLDASESARSTPAKASRLAKEQFSPCGLHY